MSPKRLNRLRPSKPFETALIVGEGETEGAFLCHLKSLYCQRGLGVQVKVEWTYGGSPTDMIVEALKLKHGADYSRSGLLLDTDVPWPAEAIKLAEINKLLLLGSKPCVEALFLSILLPDRDWTIQSVKACKKEFHARFLNESQKTESERYQKYFTKEVIDAAKGRITILNDLLKMMTE